MKDRVRAQVATLVVQAGLAFALVPRFGVPGAVTSLTCAIVVWSLLHWLIARGTTGIDASAFSFSPKIRRSKT
jgi:O-antigen/teichoic acid export membrane protein